MMRKGYLPFFLDFLSYFPLLDSEYVHTRFSVVQLLSHKLISASRNETKRRNSLAPLSGDTYAFILLRSAVIACN